MELTVDNFRGGGYNQIVQYLLSHGDQVSPRGLPTYEVPFAKVVLTNSDDCLLSNVGRKMNTGLAALEALQLIGGVSHPDLMAKVAPNTIQFMDGGAFHGAYGPRIGMQLPLIVKRLKEDPASRQAIATIWDPLYDLANEQKRDFPCTIGFQFMIRNGKLIMGTVMRSNDVWWGLTYDIVQFTQLQWTIANALGIEAGAYHHYAGSLHLYERDADAALALDHYGALDIYLTGIGGCGTTIETSMSAARQILDALSRNVKMDVKGETPTEEWLIKAIEKRLDG